MTSYVGEIRMFAGTYAPTAWHICDGSLLSISTYQALYALLGTTWGGDGVTNFGLPNLIGRLPIGQGQGTGLTARRLGQTGGTDTVQLIASQVASHTHPVYASTDGATATQPGSSVVYAKTQGTDVFYTADTSTNQAMNAAVVGTTGGAAPHANQMPTLSVTYIICLNGMFPQQS